MDRGRLIISRRIGEAFTIGDNITVTVLASSGHNVRLCVECPKDISICRDDAVCTEPKKAV